MTTTRCVLPVSCRGECGEAVTGHAEMVEGLHAVMSVVLAAPREASEEIRDRPAQPPCPASWFGMYQRARFVLGSVGETDPLA